jgi:hypothetical protein
MIVKVHPTSGIEMERVTVDPASQSIKGVPLFYGAGSEASAFFAQVTDDNGKVLASAVLKVSGKSGKLFLQDRTAPVKPYMERPRKKRGAGPMAAQIRQ